MFQHDGLINAVSNIANSLATGTLQQHNAILTFNEFVGVNEIDEWGNTIPSVSKIVNLYCKLQKIKPPNVEENIGVQDIRIYFIGYLINPVSYSPLPKKINAQISYNNIMRIGYFYPNISIMSPLAEAMQITQFTGQRIEGYFQIHEGDV